MNIYLKQAKLEQEYARYWAALSRAARNRGAYSRAIVYQLNAEAAYRNARVYMGYADE